MWHIFKMVKRDLGVPFLPLETSFFLHSAIWQIAVLGSPSFSLNVFQIREDLGGILYRYGLVLKNCYALNYKMPLRQYTYKISVQNVFTQNVCGMEWNFGARTLAFFAWRMDIPWQAIKHPFYWNTHETYYRGKSYQKDSDLSTGSKFKLGLP